MQTKQMYGLIAVLVIVIVAVGAYFALGDNDSKDNDTAPDFQTVTDCAGNVISFTQMPERIVSMDAKSTEILCELGLIDYIVGVQSDEGVFESTDFIYGFDFDINYPDELIKRVDAGTIGKYGPTSSWTYEEVMNAHPDVVVFNSSAKNLEKMKQLQEVGVTCIVLHGTADFTSLEPIYDNMSILGKAFGQTATAEKFNMALKEVTDKIFKTCSSYKGKDVVMISYTGGKMYAYGETNMKHAILRMLGCTTDMVTGLSTAVTTVEAVLQAQPDVIIFDPMGKTSSMTQLKKDIESDPLWADVNALKNNEIYYLEYNAFQSTGYWSHHFVHGIALMATIVFDEIDVDIPNVVPNEYTEYIKWVKDL